MNVAQHTALRMAVMWHGVAFLPRLRALPRAELHRACTQASDLSGERVLHMAPDAASQEFELPAFPWHRRLSGAQVIAVMVFGLWVLCDEREELCSGLVEAWPVRDAMVLSPTPARAPGEDERVTPMTWLRLVELVERGAKLAGGTVAS